MKERAVALSDSPLLNFKGKNPAISPDFSKKLGARLRKTGPLMQNIQFIFVVIMLLQQYISSPV